MFGASELKLFKLAAVVSLAFIGLILLLLGGIIPRMFQQKAVEIGEEYAVRIAQNLNHVLFQEFVPRHPEAAWGKDYREKSWQAEMDRFIHGHSGGLNIVKVKLFDRQGRVIYSTDPQMVGIVGPSNPKLHAALMGRVASGLEKRGRVWDIPGEKGPDVDLIETYVPIFELIPIFELNVPLYQRKDVIGAFEIYLEAEPLYRQIGALQRELHGLTGGLLFLVILASLVLALKGDRLIGAQSSARQAAELREKRQQGWMETILSSMDEGVAIIDETYTLVYLNKVAAHWYGDIVGERCHWAWAGKEHPCRGCLHQEVLQGKVLRDSHPGEYYGRMLETVGTLIERPDGGRAVLRVMRDVTERVRREREIEEVKRATQKRLFEERINTIQQMAVGLKHRLNNFLMGIMGVFSVLSEESQLSEEAHLVIQRCQQEADVVRELIEKLPSVTDPVVTDYIQGIQMIDLDQSIHKEQEKSHPEP